MSAEIVNFPGLTKAPLSPTQVLEEAIKAGMSEVLLLGYDADGKEYFASSTGDGGTNLWLVERFKKMLVNREFEGS